MSSAPVILEEYDLSWPSKFEKEKGHLMALTGEWNYGGIEHVGSTSVPGMVAKPVIDVMFGVRIKGISIYSTQNLNNCSLTNGFSLVKVYGCPQKNS